MCDSPTPLDPVEQMRKLNTDELIAVGEESLRTRLIEQAIFAHTKHGPITPETLDALLQDPDCTRYPVRLVFEFGEMAMHQFAQPDLDWRNAGQNGRVLYLHPSLRSRPDLIGLAVAYMLPVVNYSEVVSDGQCVSYGATLLGLMEEEFYQQIVALAEFVGAEVRYPSSDLCPAC